MFVKFSVSNLSGAATNWGIQNAIRATCEAAAGATPATPSGCDDYVVLSNVEAGGWVTNTDNSDLLTSASDTSGALTMMAPTKKNNFGIAEMAKHIKFQFDVVSSASQIVETQFGVTYPDSSSSSNSSPLFAAGSWNGEDEALTNEAHHRNWYLSTTENYFWFWNETYLISSQYFIGMGDLSGTPPSLLSENNYYVPIAGLHSADGTYHNFCTSYHLENGGVDPAHFNSNGDNKYTNEWKATSQTGTDITFSTTSPMFNIYNYNSSIVSGPTQAYRQSLNTDGHLVDSLHPVARYHPHSNYPFETLDGIKNFGRFKGILDQYSGETGYRSYINKFVYDENGERYMVVHWNPWAPMAIRAV